MTDTDQLKVILDKHGKPTKDDTSFVTENSIFDYIAALAPKSVKSSFQDLFPNADPALVDLIESMVEFNPAFRPTVKECIKNPVFDQIRNPRFEVEAPT